MKTLLIPAFAAASVLLFTGCETAVVEHDHYRHGSGYHGGSAVYVDSGYHNGYSHHDRNYDDRYYSNGYRGRNVERTNVTVNETNVNRTVVNRTNVNRTTVNQQNAKKGAHGAVQAQQVQPNKKGKGKKHDDHQ